MRCTLITEIGFWVVLLLSGCATYRPVPISPTEAAAGFDGRTLAESRLQKFVALSIDPDRPSQPIVTWDLDRLTLAALYYHPDLALADAKLAVAEAAVTSATQRPNPSVNLAAAFGTSAVSGAITPGAIPATLGPVINFVIETFGKREKRTAQAARLADAAQWDVASASWQVRGRVRTVFVDLWAAQRRAALARRRLDLEDELVSLLDHRVGVGEISGVDAAREHITRAQIALASEELDASVLKGQVLLAEAIGISSEAAKEAQLNFGDLDHAVPDIDDRKLSALRRQALTERTDIRASLARYQASEAAVRLEVANQYPNLTLGSGYNYDFGVNKYVLDPSFDLPILNHNEGPLAVAMAERRKTAAEFSVLQGQIIGAIDEGMANYRSAILRSKMADTLVQGSIGAERGTLAAFENGQLDRPTLIAAELVTVTAQQSSLDAAIDLRRALGTLEDDFQTGLIDRPGLPTALFERHHLIGLERSP